MKTGPFGFLCGAVLAGAGMLALHDLVEVDLRGPWRDGRVAEIVVLNAAQHDFLRGDIEFAGETVFGTHISDNALGIYIERKESARFLPRSFAMRAGSAERAMVAAERLCPVVILATPEAIRISPCLARVDAR